MPYSNMTKIWKGTKNLEKLKRIILSHSRKLTKFPRLSKAGNLEHIDLEGCTSLLKVNSSIVHHHKLTFLSFKGCSHLRIMPPTVHLVSLEVLNLSGCSELENLQDFSHNLKELYLAGTAIREMPSSTGDLTRLVTLDLEDCVRLQYLPPGISNLKSMVTLKVSGCSNLKSLPNLDALFLRESVPSKLHSAIKKSRATLEVFLRAFEPASSIALTQANWSWVRITFLPPSVLQSLVSRLYCLVSLSLCNARVVEIPEELCWLASVKTLDLGGNSFSQIPKSIKELHKLHSLRLRHCKNLRSLPELPRNLEILNAHGCVSLESFPPDFEKFPRLYTFSNCFNLSPEMVREFIRKIQYSVEGMTKVHQLVPTLSLPLFFLTDAFSDAICDNLLASLEQEHSNRPAFSICMPASADRKYLVNFQAGSSVVINLTSGIIKTLSGFAFSVVVEFWDNYSNAAGFGIKCICRKMRTDLSRRREIIFHYWAPKEPLTVKEDHIFVFGCANMITAAEEIDPDFLGDIVKFEFHPVDWENNLLDESCTVKKCRVNLFTAATDDSTLRSSKRPSSSKDQEDLSSMEHTTPPYKKCRLKSVFETVILNLRKRKREMSVSKVHLGPVSARLEHDQIYRYLKPNEGKELGSHELLTIETAPSQSSSSLTDSPTSIRKPVQTTAQIHQVSRAQSFERKLLEGFEDNKFEVSVSLLSPKTRKPEGLYSIHDAAIRIQDKFRGHKCRKQRMFTRQGTILIQARWRGYQARKNFQDLIMSMGISK